MRVCVWRYVQDWVLAKSVAKTKPWCQVATDWAYLLGDVHPLFGGKVSPAGQALDGVGQQVLHSAAQQGPAAAWQATEAAHRA